MSRASPLPPIAVVGLGAIFPGRGDTTGFWRDLFEGRDTLSDVPASHWLPEDYYDADPGAPDRVYGVRGGFIPPTAFDPVAFGVPPNALASTDTAQLLALIAAKRVLEDAERDSGGKIDRERTSVVLGVASATELTAHMAGRLQRPVWLNAMRDAGLSEDVAADVARRMEDHYVEWRESTFPGLLGNVVAGRIANRLDLGGSNYVTDAACASSLSALQMAMHELRLGDSDTVLTGGVDALNDILMYMCFSKTPALSPTGDCRPFSDQADGTMLGEGVGMLALRRLEDAERDGNKIFALIRGLGGGSDGRATAIYAPLPSGQARTLKRAYDQAGYSPATVELLEGHGTGTKAGDKAELEGLHTVFDVEDAPDAPWCAIGSVKSQIGHTKAAAGSASLVKAIEALNRKILPPTIKVDRPADAVRQSPSFYINTKARPWIRGGDHLRRASVSSFGFGGSNFHATLEEYTGSNQATPWRAAPAELFLFSADSSAALADDIAAVAEGLDHEDGFARRAGETHAAFDAAGKHRAALVAESAEDLKSKSARLAERVRSGEAASAPLGRGVHVGAGPKRDGAVALLFSGQGSQYVGMGADLAMAFPAARAVWDAAAAHPDFAGDPLHDLSFPPAAFDDAEADAQMARLTEMANAQPAIAAVALSHLALLDRLGLQADMSGGHSFGEVMALRQAGVFNDETALSIARLRGRLMTEAAAGSDGAMLAVQTDAGTIAPIVETLAGEVVVANDNGPSQVALSGPFEAIEAAAAACAERGLKARRLPVATAFHSKIVADAVSPFLARLEAFSFSAPKTPVYANTTAKTYAKGSTAIAKRLAGQIAAPVKFRDQIEAMYAAGARVFVEAGPGSIVSSLVRDTLGDRDALVLSLDHKRENGVTRLLDTAGALAAAGFDLDFAALYADAPPPPAPEVPSKHAVMISGANYGKPYPPADGAAGRARPSPDSPDRPPTTSPPSPHTPPSPPESPHAMTDTLQPRPAPGPGGTAPSDTVERVWREVSQRHADYLNATTAAHTAYLNAAAQVLGAAAPGPTTEPGQAARLAPPAATPPPASAPVENPTEPQSPAPNGHAPSAGLNGHAPNAHGAANGSAEVQPGSAAPPRRVPETPAAPQPAAPDALQLVTDLVAEKTGYPADMLDADMDLEGELGVDSIKQVEILSALREQTPDLPEIEPETLPTLRTIRLIADFLDDALGGGPVATEAPPPGAVPASAPAANGNAPHVSAPSGGGVTADAVRALIAEKTGYPADMLEDDMDLEGELGVDSIKQVEILSALREENPELPEIEPEALAGLRTIRKIADFFA